MIPKKLQEITQQWQNPCSPTHLRRYVIYSVSPNSGNLKHAQIRRNMPRWNTSNTSLPSLKPPAAFWLKWCRCFPQTRAAKLLHARHWNPLENLQPRSANIHILGFGETKVEFGPFRWNCNIKSVGVHSWFCSSLLKSWFKTMVRNIRITNWRMNSLWRGNSKQSTWHRMTQV